MVDNQSSLFHQAILKYHEPNRGHPLYNSWLNYALSTNQRGQFVVDVLKLYKLSLKSIRHLDIGCGYGGLCIAAAKAGAHSVGIDIDPRLIEFSEINQKDHPELGPTFYQMDILDTEAVQRLGKFDVITCDNVIEHVSNLDRLLTHISLLLKKSGFAYITIPNAFSLGQVHKDCHYGLFGISLLDPWDASIYVKHALSQPTYDVSFYYSYSQYVDLFHKYGLHVSLYYARILEKDIIDKLWEQGLRLKQECQDLLENGFFPPELNFKISQILDVYIQKLATSCQYYSQFPEGWEKVKFLRRLVRDYVNEVWFIIVSRNSVTLSLRSVFSLIKRSVKLIHMQRIN